VGGARIDLQVAFTLGRHELVGRHVVVGRHVLVGRQRGLPLPGRVVGAVPVAALGPPWPPSAPRGRPLRGPPWHFHVLPDNT
jgi:hypothetical protein